MVADPGTQHPSKKWWRGKVHVSLKACRQGCYQSTPDSSPWTAQPHATTVGPDVSCCPPWQLCGSLIRSSVLLRIRVPRAGTCCPRTPLLAALPGPSAIPGPRRLAAAGPSSFRSLHAEAGALCLSLVGCLLSAAVHILWPALAHQAPHPQPVLKLQQCPVYLTGVAASPSSAAS